MPCEIKDSVFGNDGIINLDLIGLRDCIAGKRNVALTIKTNVPRTF
jgi:hypothetical protein